ncbi:hypothetical protein LINGRAHAP2_LOCUS30510, partial [Linum grandiflorum]
EGSSPSAHLLICRFVHEFDLWTTHLSPDERQGRRDIIVISHGNSQQANDLMSRSVPRRLLCDGSFHQDVQKAGVIMVNLEGRVVDGVAARFFYGSSVMAEARAVLTTCILASREEGRADIWSDCSEVLQACRLAIQDCPWECAAVETRIHDFLNAFPYIHSPLH